MANRTKTPTKKTTKKAKKKQPIRQYPTEAPRPAPKKKHTLGQQVDQSYTPERKEKIRRLTELQEIEADIRTTKGYGRDAGSLEAIRDIKMPVGFSNLRQVAGVMGTSVTRKRKSAKKSGMPKHTLYDAMNIAKAESTDILKFF